MNIEVRDLEGRPHLVVPCVMLTVGVHAGSRGPVFYSPDVLDESVAVWNGRPVVVYHPALFAKGLAGHPEVFNRQRIGTLFNTNFDGRRLTADAWIDAARVQQVEPKILDAIRAGRTLEVSTGLLAEHDDRPSFNMAGNPVVAVRRMDPDHLAVLPDQVGACSIAAGCGMLRA